MAGRAGVRTERDHLRKKRVAASLTLLVVLLGAASCKPPVPSSPVGLAPASAPPGRWTEYALEKGWINVSVGLPVRGHPPFPAVLNPIVPDPLLLERGIAVVRYRTNWSLLTALRPTPTPSPTPSSPSPSPKPQIGAWILASDRPGNVGEAYFSFITHDAKRTIPKVFDFLETLPEIDPDHVGIMGSSTSGFTALQALAGEPRFALGVVQVACGDYHLFLRSSRLAFHDDERWLQGGRLPLDRDYEEMLERIEPIRHVDRFPPRPLLLMTGSEDPAIPPACVHRTVELLASAYQKAAVPDRFEFIEFPRSGHNLGHEAAERAVAFVERWLGRRATQGRAG